MSPDERDAIYQTALQQAIAERATQRTTPTLVVRVMWQADVERKAA